MHETHLHLIIEKMHVYRHQLKIAALHLNTSIVCSKMWAIFWTMNILCTWCDHCINSSGDWEKRACSPNTHTHTRTLFFYPHSHCSQYKNWSYTSTIDTVRRLYSCKKRADKAAASMHCIVTLKLTILTEWRKINTNIIPYLISQCHHHMLINQVCSYDEQLQA